MSEKKSTSHKGSPMLQVRNLRAGYGEMNVLHGVSLHLTAGEIVTLVGANGSGKSTLIGAIAGLVKTSGGEILAENERIDRKKPEKIIRAGISMVPEGRQLFAPMTVADNLILGGYILPSGNERQREMEKVFELFPILKERREQPAGTLSGGEQQMLAIGRALMSRPKVLLLDEPSMGLAPIVSAEIFRTLLSLRSESGSILLVEQNANLAFKVADRGYVIETGRIVLEGSTKDLLKSEEVRRAYLGGGYRDVWEK